jgi:hypothetical protein
VKILETLKGIGIVTIPDGGELRAQYDLQITQDEPPEGADAPPTVHYKHICGRVWSGDDPYFVPSHVRKVMQLQLQDGRKLNFFHRELDGTIGLSKWLG